MLITNQYIIMNMDTTIRFLNSSCDEEYNGIQFLYITVTTVKLLSLIKH